MNPHPFIISGMAIAGTIMYVAAGRWDTAGWAVLVAYYAFREGKGTTK